jgi:hypothetical protein
MAMSDSGRFCARTPRDSALFLCPLSGRIRRSRLVLSLVCPERAMPYLYPSIVPRLLSDMREASRQNAYAIPIQTMGLTCRIEILWL